MTPRSSEPTRTPYCAAEANASVPSRLGKLRLCASTLLAACGALPASQLSFVCAAFVAVAASAVTAQAQSDQRGTVTGRVLNPATGRYLNNARVTIQELNRDVFTNQAGEYRISNVPAGEYTLSVFHTGFQIETAKVQVAGDSAVSQNFSLRSSAVSGEEDTIVLDAFEITSGREYNAAAIAINEQRFSANVRNVVSTDAFGEINQGNIGEFLKHVPGVTFEVKDGNNPSGIQIRGFNSNYTNVTMDGGQMASTALANTQNHTRQFLLDQATINNLSRIEVIKLPTPDIAANAMGGSVNLISKTALEYAKPTLNFSAYLSGNSKQLTTSKEPGPGNGDEYRIRPSASFTYALPVSRKFGVVITGSHSSQFYLRNEGVPGRRYSGSGASVTNPQTISFRYGESPNLEDKTGASIRLDWAPWQGHAFDFTATANAVRQQQGTRTFSYNVGNNPVAWGETFTRGATGSSANGTANFGGSWQQRHGLSRTLNGRYTFTGDTWSAELAGTFSHSNNRTRDAGKGFFKNVSTQLRNVRTVNFEGINNDEATVDKITVTDAAGAAIDETKLANYNITNVTGERMDSQDTVKEVRGSLSKELEFLPFPMTVRVGGLVNEMERDLDFWVASWTYLGPDGRASSGDETAGSFIDPSYAGASPGYGRPGYEWVSPWLVYDRFVSNPEQFTQTATQQGDMIRNAAVRSPIVGETITAGYIMGDARFFRDRLRLVGGVRYELTENEGWGVQDDVEAIYQRDANGNLLRVNNQLVRRPEAGASGSGQEAALRYKRRAFYNSRDYDDLFPSVHGTVKILEPLQLRLGYAKTTGRPRIVDIVPTITVNPNTTFDPNGSSAEGTITASNTTLKPWFADNYDASLEYYLPGNGVISAGYFRKEITGFFATLRRRADAALLQQLGLSDDYLDWDYSTRINAGDAVLKGFELNINQPLGIFGNWGKGISVFANYTKVDVSSSGIAQFTDFIPRSRNFGLQFTLGRFSGNIKLNQIGKRLRETRNDFPGAAEYIRARDQLDANLEYAITKNFAIFIAGRNLTDEPNEWEISGGELPSWAHLTSHQTFGAQYSLGIKGSF
jgi:iron complex outermembrane recepter protein